MNGNKINNKRSIKVETTNSTQIKSEPIESKNDSFLIDKPTTSAKSVKTEPSNQQAQSI